MNETAVGRHRPATVQRRALAPDLARGLMLAPIAVANVMIYLHARPYGLRQHIVEHGAVDRAVTAVLVTFVDGRAYPLFAALLGYGLVKIAPASVPAASTTRASPRCCVAGRGGCSRSVSRTRPRRSR